MKVRQVVRYGVAAIGLLALAVAQPSAAYAVTFEFSNSVGFVLGSATTGNTFGTSAAQLNSGIEFFGPAVNPAPPGPGGLPPANTFTTIGWGCNLGTGLNCAANDGDANTVVAINPHTGATDPSRSSLQVIGLANTIEDDGVFVPIATVEHDNTAISGRALGSVDIDSILRINTLPLGTEDSTTLEVNFTETLNTAPCANPAPNGSVCDDFFQFDPSIFAPLVITHLGEKFLVEFQFQNIVNAVPVIDENGVTLFTAENVTSSLELAIAITKLPVPEPATLMLLGTGLVAVGVAAAKRSRAKKV